MQSKCVGIPMIGIRRPKLEEDKVYSFRVALYPPTHEYIALAGTFKEERYLGK